MENSSLETVSGNESSAMTASFGNDSKHARNSETAKNCLTTVYEFEPHRPSNKGTKLLLKVIKAIIIIRRKLRQQFDNCNQNQHAERQESNQGAQACASLVENNHIVCHSDSHADIISN